VEVENEIAVRQRSHHLALVVHEEIQQEAAHSSSDICQLVDFVQIERATASG
jgi:hypothetical protein